MCSNTLNNLFLYFLPPFPSPALPLSFFPCFGGTHLLGRTSRQGKIKGWVFFTFILLLCSVDNLAGYRILDGEPFFPWSFGNFAPLSSGFHGHCWPAGSNLLLDTWHPLPHPHCLPNPFYLFLFLELFCNFTKMWPFFPSFIVLGIEDL